MPTTIDYYLTAASPWTYLGHDAFIELARAHGAEIRWRPMSLATVFPETGGLPLAKRAPARQAYRLVELQRWREKRGLPLNLHPAYFPVDPSLADRCAIALAQDGGDPAGFYSRALAAVWAEDKNIAEQSVLEELLSAAGHEPAAVLERAGSEGCAEAYEAYSREAITRDVFGAPTYIVGGETFWGQDRLDLLADMLASGREPYRAE